MDGIDYYFDSITQFHAELEDMFGYERPTEWHVKDFIHRLFKFLSKYQNDYLRSPNEIAQVAYRLMDSSLYLKYSTLILKCILERECLDASVSDHTLEISYAFLYYLGGEDARYMEYIVSEACVNQQNQLFRKIILELQSFTGGYPLMSISFKLLFEMGKIAQASEADLDFITLDQLYFFFNLIECTRDDSEEEFNYQIIHFVLVLNEQYMMAHMENKVLDALSRKFGQCDTLSQNLVFMLNRSEDRCVQMLILKMIYGIISRSDMYDFFYTNDLYVLVDIILRRLEGLGDDKECSRLCNGYLRVLYPLLTSTELRHHVYKKYDIHKTLCSLIAPYLHRKIRQSTQNLVQKILEDWWEPICNKLVAPLLGKHVKHVLIESGNRLGESAIVISNPGSTISSDTENDEIVVERNASNGHLCV